MATKKTDNETRPRFLKFGQFGAFSEPFRKIAGSTLTVPGQARSLAALIQSNQASGSPFPQHASGGYDGTEAEALAAAQFEQLSEEEKYELYLSSLKKPADKPKDQPKDKPADPPADPPEEQ